MQLRLYLERLPVVEQQVLVEMDPQEAQELVETVRDATLTHLEEMQLLVIGFVTIVKWERVVRVEMVVLVVKEVMGNPELMAEMNTW
jgi:hypothetical protein